MKRSHSRSTYIFDKPYPRAINRLASSNAKKVLKKIQQRKQRQYDNKL
jgi:hypothetical protein